MEKGLTFQSLENKRDMTTANILDVISEEQIRDIIDIDAKIFPTMPIEEKEIRDTLKSRGVQILLKNLDSKTIGYIISLPHEDAYEFLSENDPNIIKEIGGLYIESIGILPEYRSLKNFNRLCSALVSEAQQRGFKKITAHVRSSEGLSEVLQKRFGALKFSTYDNWAGFNEPFDYLEILL